jgi:catechol 2,3-dioxygenase
MQIAALGHVVLRVRDQRRAEAFYHGLLGIPIAARLPRLQMTFFTLGNHHDFAVAANAHGPDAPAGAPGLVHVAFRIDGGVEALRAAKAELEGAGVSVQARDHRVSKSIYFNDPDGNGVELYVDTDDRWKQAPMLVAHAEPLEL